MKLYHGTDSKFKKFDISRSGTGHGTFLGSGIYFSSEKSDALQYGSTIYEVDVPVDNLLDLRGLSQKEIAVQLSTLELRDGITWIDAFKQKDKISRKIKNIRCPDRSGWCDLQWEYEGEWYYIPRRSTTFTQGNEIDIATTYMLRKLGFEDPDNLGHLGKYFGSAAFKSAVLDAGYDGLIHHGTNIGDRGDEYIIMNPLIIRNLTIENQIRQYIRILIEKEQRKDRLRAIIDKNRRSKTSPSLSFTCNSHSLGFIDNKGNFINIRTQPEEYFDYHKSYLLYHFPDRADDEEFLENGPDSWIKVSNANEISAKDIWNIPKIQAKGLIDMWLDCKDHAVGIQDPDNFFINLFEFDGGSFNEITIPDLIEQIDPSGELKDY